MSRPTKEPDWARELVSPEQRDAAARLGRPVAFEEPTTGMRFVLIPGGTFRMGSSPPASYENERPLHEVTLSPYYLGVYEVTNAEYRKKVPQHGCYGGEKGDRRPAGCTGHAQATEYAAWLSERASLHGFRLPSEAQWEHACRAGSTTPWFWGDDPVRMPEFGWNEGPTRDVGQKRPNPWGLFDVYGNVAEWCSDRFGPYTSGSQTDPEGPESGTLRLVRGGSVNDQLPMDMRSARRLEQDPAGGLVIVGFRLAFTGSPP